MKQSKINLISIVTFLTFIAVIIIYLSIRKDTREILGNDIIENDFQYKKLVSQIKNEDFKEQYGKLIQLNNLPINIKSSISKLEINGKVNYIIVYKENDSNYFRIEFVLGNWTLYYTDLPNNFVKPQAHETDNFIESWGITKNWSISHDNDYI